MLVTLKDWSDDDLERAYASLQISPDPYAKQALNMIKAEQNLRRARFGKSCQNKAQQRVAEKEPAMKTVWYAAKDNDVRFANNENSLTSQGFNNPQSFTTQGDISGLVLIDDDDQTLGASNVGSTAA